MPAHSLAVGVAFIYAPPYDNPIAQQTTLGILPGVGGTVQLDAQVIPGGELPDVRTSWPGVRRSSHRMRSAAGSNGVWKMPPIRRSPRRQWRWRR